MKKYFIIFAVLSTLIFIGPNMANAINYTMPQVQTHNTATNCWAVVSNNVYNLTGYISLHPGGSAAITALCGTDATAAFTAMHGSSQAAQNALSSLLIGNLVVSDNTSPSIPTNLSASAISSSRINLNWTASTDNIGVTGYKIFRDGTQVGTSITNSFNNMGLTASTTYAYTVSAFDAAGNNSGLSNTATATTLIFVPDNILPSIPTNLIAAAITSSQINLNWTASTDNIGVTGYKIFRNGSQIGTSTVASFNNTGLTTSTTYFYTVSAFDTAGNNSELSNTATATTLASSNNHYKDSNENENDHEHGQGHAYGHQKHHQPRGHAYGHQIIKDNQSGKHEND
jgi:chitodextrinase